MKYIPKINAFIILLLSISSHLNAQRPLQVQDRNWTQAYTNALGLKIGNVFQLDYKHFITTDISIAVSTGSYLNNEDGLYSSVILTYHHDTHIKNLYWFYGGGMAMRNSQFPIELGMAGSIGFEAISNEKKLNFFVDIQPTAYYPLRRQISLSSVIPRGISELNYYVSASVGVRYILIK